MARTKRALNPNNGSGFYHVMTRTVAREFLLKDHEKDEFTRLMRKAAAFCGVEILTHAVMSNHYHLLIFVPPPLELSETEVLRRVEAQVSAEHYHVILREIAQLRHLGGEIGEKAVAERLARITRRMHSLAGFMHTLNQSMSEWYNREHNRIGPLWAGRFKSVLVEGSDPALLAMATYIDLNPVRAGIVSDPKDYRWSGYGEALAGHKLARAGLIRLLAMKGSAATWAAAAPNYRRLLFVRGEKTDQCPGIPREKVAEVLAKGGEITLCELLHCRVRYMSDGVAIGSRSFLERVFEANRSLFGKRRADGPRLMKGGAAWGGLMTLRDLRLAPIS